MRKRIGMVIALVVAGLAMGSANAQDKPNVVVMLADNVGYGDIGAYGAGEIRGMPTPRIDQLASEGLRLTQYLVEPSCTPSRAALWRQYRIYPKQFMGFAGNPSMYGVGGYRAEGTGFPAIFNIEWDPREEVNIVGTSAWVIAPYLRVVGEYQKSLEKYPNPKAVHLTQFGR